MKEIKIYNKIAKCGLDLLPEGYVAKEDVTAPVGALIRSYDLHNEVLPDSLLAIARAGAGTNNIPVDECANAGIAVFNTPSANANAVKELTLLGLLISSRRVVPAIEWAQGLKGNGADVAVMVEK